MRKYLVIGAVVAVLAFSLAGCTAEKGSAGVSTAVGTAKDGNELSIEKSAMKLATATEKGGYSLVGTEELKKMIDDGDKLVIIDTMPADSFKGGHIPGAVNAELPKEGEATPEQLEAFKALLPSDKDATVVVYCGFTACGRSDIGAAYAVEQGYTDVLRQPGGIVAWQDAGFDAEK